ncbi:MAG TPA: hypothetical protein PKI19_11860 [Elusimicrobiales bacterium]|nr:hypothetical protein [Elusimicrobiales bacterium]
MKILFICTGNTCRSVLAHYYAAKLAAAGKLPLEFSSAGLQADKSAAQPAAVTRLLRKTGIKASAHTPTQLTAALAEGAGLILTMTAAHKAQISALYPAAASKTFTLTEYAGEGGDIEDPYGRDDEFYADTFKIIKAAAKAALEKLKKK